MSCIIIVNRARNQDAPCLLVWDRVFKGEMAMTDQPNSVYHDYMNREENTEALCIRNAGRQEYLPGGGWGPGVRDHFRLCHVTEGRGVFVCGDRRWVLQAGDTFLVCPNVRVSCCADDAQSWSYIWVGFSGHEAKACMEQAGFSAAAPVLLGEGIQEIDLLLSNICESFGSVRWKQLAATAGLYALVAFLVSRNADEKDTKANIKDCAQMAADYIVTHCDEPITVEWLAEYTSVSHSSLYRRFVEMFGVSPKRFLLEYRVERACQMLVSTELSVQEISSSVGFEDPFYFSRAFKEIKGVSPRQYANAYRSK